MPKEDFLNGDVLCESINAALRQLSYKYSESSTTQTLKLLDYPDATFSKLANGAVAGGSSRWMNKKHAHGAVHEPGTLACMHAIHSLDIPISSILDIGALYGYFTIIGSKIFENAEIRAFEMNPDSYSAMLSNLSLNPPQHSGNIIPENCALSDTTQAHQNVHIENFTLQSARENARKTIKSLVRNFLGKLYYKSPTYRKHIDCAIDFWCIDDYCSTKNVKPDLIKIDVEGYQAKVIPGSLEKLRQHKPFVLLEFDSPVAVNSFGVTNREIVQPLFDMGYRLIWGNHRDAKGEFSILDQATMGEMHERNSLGLFYAEERLANIARA